ncbi:MAG: Ig-like domain-containing protein [Myxococcaceae bacterium]|nr:Ig-like domain-containing protein [Myxococcaceae bacterium]
MKRLVVTVAFALAGCLDFEAARETCKQAGNCLSENPPTLSASVPPAGATKVDVGTDLSLTFSKAMRQDGVNLSISPPVAVGTQTWDADSKVLQVSLASTLAFDTTYTVVITGQAADGSRLADNTQLTFSTASAPDEISPTLVATVPTNLATAVPVTSPLTLSFSEAMNQDALVLDVAPGVELKTATWSQDGKQVSFPMHTAFDGDTNYQVTVLQARDLAGNDLSGNPGFSFKTGAAPDTTAPVVVSASPPADSTNIDFTVSPSVAFSEPMGASASSALSVVLPDGGPFTACVNVFDPSKTVLTCTHAGSQLPGGARIKVKVAASASDVTGNPMGAPFEFAFTTGTVQDTTKPTILGFSPPNGAIGLKPDASVSVVFSEPMDQGNTQGAFKLLRIGGSPVAGSYLWSDGGTVLTLKSPSPFALAYDAGYSMQVDTTAKDLAGNTLAVTTSSSFGTTRYFQGRTYALGNESANVSWDGGAKFRTDFKPPVLRTDNGSFVDTRIALSFSLQSDAGLNPPVVTVMNAQLHTTLLTDAGSIYYSDVTYTSDPGPAVFTAACRGFCPVIRDPGYTDFAYVGGDVYKAVNSNKTRVQYRIYTSAQKVVRLYAGFDGGLTVPYLDVQYEAP